MSALIQSVLRIDGKKYSIKEEIGIQFISEIKIAIIL